MGDSKESAKNASSTAGKPIICKAAVLWKPGEKYSVQNIVVAPPKKDQELAPAFPIILGHEAAGAGFGSVWNVAKVEKGSTVAVFGLGTIGLSVVEACKLAGASRIIGVDINPRKIELAKKFGVTDVINPNDHPDVPVSKVILEMTGGGVHYSFEVVGLSKLMTAAVESPPSVIGTTVIVGFANAGEKFDINAQDFIWGRSVLASNVGRISVTDLPGLVERCIQKEFDLDVYISHTMPFSKINEAMEIFESGECLRINLNTAE